MAKAILSSILESQLGKYVDGLSGDSLQVGLWSGEMLLQNLSLKSHALAELNLPVTVVKGTIRRIHVIVPWNQLGSSSVQILIEGIHALVVPNTKLPSQEELLQSKRNRLERAELLRQHDRLASQNNSGGEDESTFLSRLTERIVDNLKITLKDIHFRYEDRISNPEKPFVCGVMVQTFAFHTTDAEGVEVFVDRTAGHEQYVHKVAKVFRLCAYWDRVQSTAKQEASRSSVGYQQVLLQDREDLDEEMDRMIYVVAQDNDKEAGKDMSTADGGEERRAWLLKPCSMDVQLTKNETMDYSVTPKHTVNANLHAICLGLSREQYEDMRFVEKAFAGRKAVESHFMYAKNRPFHDVTTRPLDWWDYAVHCVLVRQRKQASSRSKVPQSRDLQPESEDHQHVRRRMRWSTVERSCLERRMYIEAYRSQVEQRAPLDPQSKHARFMMYYEFLYPVDVVMALRSKAENEQERAEQAARKTNSATSSAAASGSWYSYFFGASGTADPIEPINATENDAHQNVLSEKGRAELKKVYDEAVQKEATIATASNRHECKLFSARLHLRRGSLKLYNYEREVIVSANIDGSIALLVRPSNEWEVNFRLQHFEILNCHAKDTQFHQFCTISSAAKRKNPTLPCVTLDASCHHLDRSSSDSSSMTTFREMWKIRVSSMPLRLMVDVSFLVFINDFFMRMLPDNQLERAWNFATSSVSEFIFSEDQEEELIADITSSQANKRVFDVLIDMSAPVFVFPESMREPDSPVVIVDLGRFCFKNDVAAASATTSPDVRGANSGVEPSSCRLFWRLDIVDIQVLLGRNGDLIEEDDKFLKMRRLVEQFNLNFSIETTPIFALAPPPVGTSTRKLKPGVYANASEIVDIPPQTLAKARVPRIVVSLSEEQIIKLGRIHSSMLNQLTPLADLARDSGIPLASSDQESTSSQLTKGETLGGYIPAEAEEVPVHQLGVGGTKRHECVGDAGEKKSSPIKSEKHKMRVELLFECVVLHLRETAQKDAFCLVLTQSSFGISLFSSTFIAQAKLKSLVMEDRLYDQSSPFFKLASTGDNTHEASRDHLIVVTVVGTTPTAAASISEKSEADLLVDMKFNVLEIQWNPSSVALLYRIVSSYVESLQEHSSTALLDKAGEGLRSIWNDDRSTISYMTNSLQSGRNQSVEGNQTKRSLRPSFLVRASLVKLGVTFNKDDINRQLVCLSAQQASIEFLSWSNADTTTHKPLALYEVNGVLGNFVATDLSLAKHEFYSPLLGLDSRSSQVASSMPDQVVGSAVNGHSKKDGLLRFSYRFDEAESAKSFLDAHFRPVRLVYLQQQVFEIVDYFYEGILGALLSQTILSATQLILNEEEATVVFSATVENPSVVFPIRLEEVKHIKITADTLELNHFPLVKMLYWFETDSSNSYRLARRSEHIKPEDFHVANGAFRADLKTIKVEGMTIYCSDSSSLGKNGENALMQYVSILSKPVSCHVRIEDLASCRRSIERRDGKRVLVPRFTIEFQFSRMCFCVQQQSYLMVIAMIQDNFCGELLSMTPNDSDSAPTSPTNWASSSGPRSPQRGTRPNVAYTYTRTDMEAVTIKMMYGIESFQCRLIESRGVLAGTSIAEVAANKFELSLNYLWDENPSIVVRVKSIGIRDMVGSYPRPIEDIAASWSEALGYSSSSQEAVDLDKDMSSLGILMICRRPLEAIYSWDTSKLCGKVDMHSEGLRGVVIPDGILRLVDFFVLPSKPASMVGEVLHPANDQADSSVSLASPTGRLAKNRRSSITSIILENQEGPQYQMTISVLAKAVLLIIPQDTFAMNSAQIQLRSDFEILYTCTPNPSAQNEPKEIASTELFGSSSPTRGDPSSTGENGGDLNIHSNLSVEAQGMEIVVLKFDDCAEGLGGANEQIKSFATPRTQLVQIMEPCTLHGEVTDLHPTAGQQQQIIALKFSPIEVFISYDDMCIITNTINYLSDSINRHKVSSAGMNSGNTSQDCVVVVPNDMPSVVESKTGAAVQSKPSSSKLTAASSSERIEDAVIVADEELDFHRYFTCEVNSMTLTLINDCDGCDMGLVQLAVSRCNAFLNTTFEANAMVLSGGGGFMTLVSYYNPDTRVWHPMCREWNLDVACQGRVEAESLFHTDNSVQVIVTASQPLDLTITHGLLEVAASAGGAWNRRLAGNVPGSPTEENWGGQDPSESATTMDGFRKTERKKHAPCVIRNDTGLQLEFWLIIGGVESSERQRINDGELTDLHYSHRQGKGSGLVRKYTSQERDENMQLCIHLFGSAFQPIRGIIVEQLGSRAFPLIDENGSLSMYALNLYSKLVDGRILLSISSQIKLISKLSMPLQLLVNDPTWKEPVEIPILVPAKESAIPVLLSLGTELRIKPLDEFFAWSAPIPIQTRTNADLKVESTSSREDEISNAVFAVTMVLEQSLRIVCFGEPIVLVNKLPTELQFSVKNPLSGAVSNEVVRNGSIAVGGKSGIWWIDRDQRPLFSIWIEGCESSRWMELIPTSSKKNDLFSTSLKRNDGRPLKLIIQVVEHTAKSVHVFFYADIWFINRTGLELVLGSDVDGEYYLPPTAARSYVGNAQICAYSTFTESPATANRQNEAPTIRLRMTSTSWSTRFSADPRKMSWQDECLTLRSKRREENGVSMLYEFGVSADYSTRHFGSITTLVSVIPRYLVINRSAHTVLLTEESFQMVGSASDPNSAHHILTKGDEYALYWLSGVRSKLRASVLGEWNYRWSDTFSVDLVNTIDLVVPCASPKGRNIYLQVSVKSGGISRATYLVLIEEVGIEDSLSLTMDAQPVAQGSSLDTTVSYPPPTNWKWDNLSFHVQVAGVVITIADRKPQSTSVLSPKNAAAAFADLIGKSKLAGGGASNRQLSTELTAVDEEVARLTILNIRGEFHSTPSWKQADLVVGSLLVDDLLPKSKTPRVLRPAPQNNTNRAAAGFLSVNYAEKIHPKYTWIEKLSVEAQDMNLNTSMKFVDRLNGMVSETISHFESHSYSSFASSSSSTITAMDDESDSNILEYFVSTSEGEDDSLSSVTGRKVYMKEFVIYPLRVIVSFSRDKSDSKPSMSGGFWLQNLKLKIENACLTMDSYRLNHALATQESLFDSVSNFYVKSVKSQALGLIDSIQVSSLVTSMVTGGVSSLMSTIMGKTDPSLSSATDFRYEFLTNQQLITKHSNALATCRSPAQFQRQVRHLVFDWDSNHTGLEARGCVALGILNNSRHSLVFHSTLKDGAEMRVLPVGRRQLAGVSSTTSYSMTGDDSGGFGFQNASSEWRSDRAVVIFAWGYTPTLLTSGDVYFHVQCNACNIFVTRKTARLKANLGYSAAFTSQEMQNWWSTNIVIVGDDLTGHMSLRTNSNSSVHSSSNSGTNRTNSLQQESSFDLFGSGRLLTNSFDAPTTSVDAGGADSNPIDANANSPVDEEYEVIFTTESLGLVVASIPIDSGRPDEQAVLVDECLRLVSGRPGPAFTSGRIQNGDRVLSVNGVRIFNAKHFRDLVKRMKRPIAIRFRKDSSKTNPSAFDLFGEIQASDSPAAGASLQENSLHSKGENSRLCGGGRAESIQEDKEESYDLFGKTK